MGFLGDHSLLVVLVLSVYKLGLLLNLLDRVDTGTAPLLRRSLSKLTLQRFTDLKPENLHDTEQFRVITVQLLIASVQVLRKVALPSLTEKPLLRFATLLR